MHEKSRTMLIAIAAAVSLLSAIHLFLQWAVVDFTDPALEELIREVTGKPDGIILVFDLNHIDELDATGRGITRLEGLERFRRLSVLNLEDNHIEDVTPLGRLTHLEELSLRNNGITDLDAINFAALGHLPLKRLSLRHNVVRPPDAPQVRLSDISVLADFAGLAELELRDNHIRDISPLSGLHGLRVLDISQNPVSGGDVSPLSGLSGLVGLNIREIGARDLSPIAGMKNLTYLNIHSNPDIETIAPIAGLQKLEVLIMRNVPVGDEVAYLSGLGRLHRLNMRNCGVSDLTVIGGLMEQGALQDDPGRGVEADVDIRDNPIPILARDGVDGYEPVRPYWNNISHRSPDALP